MSLYNKKLSISMPWAIVVVTGLLLAILGWLTIILADKPFLAKEGPLWVFASGMASGLVVTLAQFCLSWADARAIDRFRRMGVENVLSNRDEEAYYGRLIQSARANIDVLGSTATRLMQDFADAGSPKPEKQSLIEALKRGVAVRILVAAPRASMTVSVTRNVPSPADSSRPSRKNIRATSKSATSMPHLSPRSYVRTTSSWWARCCRGWRASTRQHCMCSTTVPTRHRI